MWEDNPLKGASRVITIPLPPEVFLYLRSTRRQEVVEIHHCVDASIEKCEKTAVTASDKPGKLISQHSQPTIVREKHFPPRAKPTLEWHDAVVVHVQERQVAELLLQHEEEGVKHVEEFWDVEDPGKIQCSDGFWIVGVVNRLTCPAVVPADVESERVGDLQDEVMTLSSYFQPSVNPHRLNRVWKRL